MLALERPGIPAQDRRAVLENVPPELRALPWMCAGPDKKPVGPKTGRSEWKDPRNHVTFDEAAAAPYPYIGAVFTKGCGLSVIDLDVKSPLSPQQQALHDAIVDAAGSYTERSCGGHGRHAYVKGTVPEGVNSRENAVEVYSDHFVIVTGVVDRPGPIVDGQKVLDDLYQRMKGPKIDAVESESEVSLPGEWVMAQVQARVSPDLVAGRFDGYPSQSEADLALAIPLAGLSSGVQQFSELFRQSRLGASLGRKGSEKNQQQYLERTYRKALAAWQEDQRHIRFGRWAADRLLAAWRGKARPLLQTIRLEELASPPVELCICGSIFPLAKVSVMVGPQGAGKSALLAQLAACVAGHDGFGTFLGMPVRRGGPVLLYSTEDSLDDQKRKLAAIGHDPSMRPLVERALPRLFVIDKSEGVARLTELVTAREGQVTRRESRPTAERDRVIESARSVGSVLIIVETASRLVEDETNADMSALMSALGHIARETGAAVVVSHHPTKAATRENDSSPESARGGSAFINNSRTAVTLFPASAEEARRWSGMLAPEDVFRLEHVKSTSSVRRQAPIFLARCSTPYGAVFRLAEEAMRDASPALVESRKKDVAREAGAKAERMRRLNDVATRLRTTLGTLSVNKLTDHREELGVAKHKVALLVEEAIAEGALEVVKRDASGRILDMRAVQRPT